MVSERLRRKKDRWKYNIVLVPQSEAGKSLSFRMELLAALGVLLLYTVIVGGLTFVLLRWTPVGVWIPVKNAELEQRYGRQITALQNQLSRVAEEVSVLERYNRKLRDALGSGLVQSEGDAASLAQASTEEEKAPLPFTNEEKSTDLEEGTVELQSQVTPRTPRSRNALQLSTPVSSSQQPSLPMRLPASGYITRGFEPARSHYGIDIAGRRGSPILAAADGHILFAGWTYDAGYMMIISHDGGYFTFYKHNQSLLKSANSFVKQGEPIALLGNTGAMSHGPHLHFEIWKDGVPRDPSEYVLNFHLF